MATLSNILLEKEILLESGTNELEVLVFDVADYTFGINVAKVREILPTAEITNLPRSHSSVRGVFKLRNEVIPCVSLMDHLGIQATRENPESKMILTDLNQQQTAFLVDDVERIRRLSWEHVLSMPDIDALAHVPVTSLARCDDRLVVILDFEKILDNVTDQYFRTDVVENPLGLAREKLQILLVEDSPTVREAIGNTLRSSGYTQVRRFHNGAEAWQWITQRFEQTGCLSHVGDLVISDIEMPQVDGLHLTKRIKSHSQLKELPVLLYSSIITADNEKKGKAVGADAQVSKPELKEVVRLADELISTAQRENRAAALRKVAEVAQAHPQQTGAPAAAEKPTTPRAQETEATDSTAEELPPEGVDAGLWRTFHRELTGRVAGLRGMVDQSQSGDRSDELFRQIGRTLHTIKSAAMVIPLDQVTTCTHLTEGLMEACREDRPEWPQEGLERYLAWLDELLLPPGGDVNAALGSGRQLEVWLKG